MPGKSARTWARRSRNRLLTKTTWYPLLKKIGALVGKQVVKESVGKAVAKVVPVVGGAISGAITYATFKPWWPIGRCAGTQSKR